MVPVLGEGQKAKNYGEVYFGASKGAGEALYLKGAAASRLHISS